MSTTRVERPSGYTLTEIAVTLAILAIAVIIAVPRLNRASENAELRDTAMALDGGLATARGEAIRTGDVQLFFLFNDAEGNPLTDAKGQPVPVLIVNDGAPGSPRQNCTIDPGEKKISLDGERIKKITGLGAPPANAGKPQEDQGRGTPEGAGNGSSFADPSGAAVTWVMFRPEGMPVAFDADCNLGSLGSGAGTFYIKNENRAYAISVSPMGTTKVTQLNEMTGEWE